MIIHWSNLKIQILPIKLLIKASMNGMDECEHTIKPGSLLCRNMGSLLTIYLKDGCVWWYENASSAFNRMEALGLMQSFFSSKLWCKDFTGRVIIR